MPSTSKAFLMDTAGHSTHYEQAAPQACVHGTLAGVGRVAFVHDWLTGMRGGEKVLEALLALCPHAELYTLFHQLGSVSPEIERHRPRTSFVRYLPFASRFYRHYLPLFPIAIEQFDLDDFDLVISTSHCVAKSAVKGGAARHLCYCFTPMRYAWDQFDAYFGPDRFGPVARRLFRVALNGLARWDKATADRVDRYVAISQHVAGRIHRYYNRSAAVVYPPVDTDFYRLGGRGPDPYCVVVSALVPYKRIDRAIEACRLAGISLRIVGVGPEMARLRHLAGPFVEFLGALPDEDVRELYRHATAFLLPGEEDFGIAPVEAQACGRPVVALGRGGACETVQDGVTGVLVKEPTSEAFADAIARVRDTEFDPVTVRQRAERFSRERFMVGMRTCIEEMMRTPDRW